MEQILYENTRIQQLMFNKKLMKRKMILCENKRILRKKGSENFEANKRNACETDLCSLRFGYFTVREPRLFRQQASAISIFKVPRVVRVTPTLKHTSPYYWHDGTSVWTSRSVNIWDLPPTLPGSSTYGTIMTRYCSSLNIDWTPKNWLLNRCCGWL